MLDDEKRVKFTQPYLQKQRNASCARLGIVDNVRPKTVGMVKKIVAQKVKVDNYQGTMVERFLSGLHVAGKALQVYKKPELSTFQR